MSCSRFLLSRFAIFLVPVLCFAQQTPTPPPPTTTATTIDAAASSTAASTTANPMNAADNQPVTSNVAKSLRVFRYRNARTRAHAFTTELASRQRLPSSFIREDIPESITSSPFLYAYTEQHTSTVPIYRFRAKDGSMFFAANQVERGALLNRGLEEAEQPVSSMTERLKVRRRYFESLTRGIAIFCTPPVPMKRTFTLNKDGRSGLLLVLRSQLPRPARVSSAIRPSNWNPTTFNWCLPPISGARRLCSERQTRRLDPLFPEPSFIQRKNRSSRSA